MKNFLSVFAAILLSFVLFGTASAKDINAERVSNGDLRKWGFMNEVNAAKQFAGYTFRFSRSDSLATRSRQTIPFAGTAVLYFKPNGRVYAWAKKQEKIIVGKWWVGKAIDAKGDPGQMLICFDYANAGKKYYTCPIIKRYGDYIHERAKGNVFNLKAGPVPKVVKLHKRKLQKIMDDLKG